MALGALSFGGDAAAEVLRYVDRDGVVHEVMLNAEPADRAAAPAEAKQAGGGDGAGTSAPAPTGGVAHAEALFAGFAYAAEVREAAKLYSLPVELILAVMKVESGFNPRAVSKVGALGLMQLMPKTAGELGVSDAFDPRQNVLGGARYLRVLLNQYDGSVALALAAYHAGLGRVEQYAGVPPFPETRRYLGKVLRFYHGYMASVGP